MSASDEKSAIFRTNQSGHIVGDDMARLADEYPGDETPPGVGHQSTVAGGASSDTRGETMLTSTGSSVSASELSSAFR